MFSSFVTTFLPCLVMFLKVVLKSSGVLKKHWHCFLPGSHMNWNMAKSRLKEEFVVRVESTRNKINICHRTSSWNCFLLKVNLVKLVPACNLYAHTEPSLACRSRVPYKSYMKTVKFTNINSSGPGKNALLSRTDLRYITVYFNSDALTMMPPLLAQKETQIRITPFFPYHTNLEFSLTWHQKVV